MGRLTKKQATMLRILHANGGWIPVGLAELVDDDFSSLLISELAGVHRQADGGYSGFITEAGRRALQKEGDHG